MGSNPPARRKATSARLEDNGLADKDAGYLVGDEYSGCSYLDVCH